MDNSSSKIKRRLARKAELARASRRRKKAYVQDLEKKVAQLNAKVLELQSQDPLTSDPRAVALALSAMTELDKPKGKFKDTTTNSISRGKERKNWERTPSGKNRAYENKDHSRAVSSNEEGGSGLEMEGDSATDEENIAPDHTKTLEGTESEGNRSLGAPSAAGTYDNHENNNGQQGNDFHPVGGGANGFGGPGSHCIKANFSGDIRRFSLPPGDFTFLALREMLGVIYRLDPDTLRITYYDEDDDVVSITSTAELQEAYRLTLPPSGNPVKPLGDPRGSLASRANHVLKIFVGEKTERHQQGGGGGGRGVEGGGEAPNPPSPGMSRRRGRPSSSRRKKKDALKLEKLEVAHKRSRHREPQESIEEEGEARDMERMPSFVHMQEMTLGVPCTVSRLWLPVHPQDTLGWLLEQFRRMTNSNSNAKNTNMGHLGVGRGERSQRGGGPPVVQRLSHSARLLDLKSTVEEVGLDDRSTLHVVQVERAEMVPKDSRDSFRVYVNCEENGFWIEATVSPLVRVHLLLQSVMAHLGFLTSFKGSHRPVSLCYKGSRIPRHSEETLAAYNMVDGDRVDVVENSHATDTTELRL
eukprot:CAMPEP_0184497100 /NCGR_PEP_ID=MMETSP0113_2-20130426/35682_1 /TAXON_ID=91329 /ORGANISM="Norrisiella sphaerica, Strain BC52" /LENGTH=584 /DNA_ID=CAMNT_0026884065 /DNA_START=113 /DNA_END=1867 /DNA_ORIENTATION=+